MAQIGEFTRTTTGFFGHIRTLALEADLCLVPIESRGAENAPDYRVHLGDEHGPEIGAGWKRTGDNAGDYVSLQLDGPTLRQPIRANLFQASDAQSTFYLLWNRPPRRDERR